MPVAAAVVALACHLPAHAQKDPDRQKKIAEHQRADLREKLDELKRSIDKTENAKSDAADALAHSEAAISDAKRNLHELGAQQQAAKARLQELARKLISARCTGGKPARVTMSAIFARR